MQYHRTQLVSIKCFNKDGCLVWTISQFVLDCIRLCRLVNNIVLSIVYKEAYVFPPKFFIWYCLFLIRKLLIVIFS